jgi:hypothetical protein
LYNSVTPVKVFPQYGDVPVKLSIQADKRGNLSTKAQNYWPGWLAGDRRL